MLGCFPECFISVIINFIYLLTTMNKLYVKAVNGLIYWLNYVKYFFIYLYSYLHLLVIQMKVESHAHEVRIYFHYLSVTLHTLGCATLQALPFRGLWWNRSHRTVDSLAPQCRGSHCCMLLFVFFPGQRPVHTFQIPPSSEELTSIKAAFFLCVSTCTCICYIEVVLNQINQR